MRHFHGATWIGEPVRQAFRFAEGGQPMIPSRVPKILSAAHEATIRRLVVAIVVDAIDLLRGVVTMGQRPVREDGELAPFGTPTNATPAVLGVAAVVGILAALLHAVPDRVQPSRMTGAIMTVLGATNDQQVSGPTAARLRFQRDEMPRTDQSFGPTFASTRMESHEVWASACGWSIRHGSCDRPRGEDHSDLNIVRVHDSRL